MKKFISTMLLAAVSILSFGQGAETSTAIIRLREGDVAQAKTYIDKAYEVTMAKRAKGEAISEKVESKFWFYYGSIYFEVHISKKPEIKSLSENALEIATESFLELCKVDVNQRYIQEGKTGYFSCLNNFINRAQDAYNSGDFAVAMVNYEISYNMFLSNCYQTKIDTGLIYNAALSAQYAKDYENAIRLNKELLELNYKPATTYLVLSQLYNDIDDNANSLAYLNEGLSKYPRDQYLLKELVNYYIRNKMLEEALPKLELAIELDPTNAYLYNAYGTILLQLGDEEKAEAALLQAVALNDSIAEAYYSLGAIQVERANALVEPMNAKGIKEADYNKLKAQQKKHFEDSLPYFERALFLKPDDVFTLEALKVVYYKLDMDEKSLEMKKRIDALKG